jgi:hypothetical protein
VLYCTCSVNAILHHAMLCDVHVHVLVPSIHA